MTFLRVIAQEPEARLLVVGRKPPQWLRYAVRHRPGIELHADVPEVKSFLASSEMLAVPLRIGGGSRLEDS